MEWIVGDEAESTFLKSEEAVWNEGDKKKGSGEESEESERMGTRG